MQNNFIQYELWKDCKNNCKFCFNKGQKDVDKVKSLDFVFNKLNDYNELKDYNEVGFIGGEFFDDQLKDHDVKIRFYKLFDKCKELVESGNINKIYITTSLIYNIDLYLIPFLNYLNQLKILKYCLLCTSYDLKYRFHTKSSEQLWKDNILFLKDSFPDLRVHTEIIATGFFMQAVLDNSFSINDFKHYYNTSIDYIEPGSGFYYYDKKSCAKDMPDFFPTKEQVIKFLNKTVVETKEIDINTFVSSDVRSDKVYIYYNEKNYCVSNRRKSNSLIDIKDLKQKYEIGINNSNETIGKYVKVFKETLNDI